MIVLIFVTSAALIVAGLLVTYLNYKYDTQHRSELPEPLDQGTNHWTHGYELLTGRKR